MTILQQSTPDGERGRVISVLQAAMSAASVLSMGFAGILGDAIGIRGVFLVAGGITARGFVVAVIGYRPGRLARTPADPSGEASGGLAATDSVPAA